MADLACGGRMSEALGGDFDAEAAAEAGLPRLLLLLRGGESMSAYETVARRVLRRGLRRIGREALEASGTVSAADKYVAPAMTPLSVCPWLARCSCGVTSVIDAKLDAPGAPELTVAVGVLVLRRGAGSFMSAPVPP